MGLIANENDRREVSEFKYIDQQKLSNLKNWEKKA